MKSGIVEFSGHLGKPGDWAKSDKNPKNERLSASLLLA